MIAERELCREARRILRKLLVHDAELVRRGDGKYSVRRASRPERSEAVCAPEFVAAFRTRDWIATCGTEPESYRLGGAGAAWLRRAQADGDPYAAQHQIRKRRAIVDAQGVAREVVVNEAESPLARLYSWKLIDPVQYASGERLRRDYTLAHLEPRLGIDLTQLAEFGKRAEVHDKFIGDTVVAAKQRFAHAMIAVGPGLSDLLFDVCCALVGLEEAERRYGWPVRAGKAVLCIALDRLAAHYGLVVAAPLHAPLRGWRKE